MAVNSNIYAQFYNAMPKQSGAVAGLSSLLNSYQAQQAKRQQAEQLAYEQKRQQAADARQQDLLKIQQAQEARRQQAAELAMRNRQLFDAEMNNQGMAKNLGLNYQQRLEQAAPYDPARANTLAGIYKELHPTQGYSLKQNNAGEFVYMPDSPGQVVNSGVIGQTKTPTVDMSNMVIGGKGNDQYGKLEDGMRRTWPDGKNNPPVDIPIKGSKTAYSRTQDEKKDQANNDIVGTAAQTVYEDSDRALDLIIKFGHAATGSIGAATGWIPEAPAGQLKKHLESIKGNVAVDQLLKIKKSGAGLGQVPQQQLEMLARLLGELSVNTDPRILEYNVRRVKEIYTEIVKTTGGDPVKIYKDRLKKLTHKPTTGMNTADDYLKSIGY